MVKAVFERLWIDHGGNKKGTICVFYKYKNNLIIFATIIDNLLGFQVI